MGEWLNWNGDEIWKTSEPKEPENKIERNHRTFECKHVDKEYDQINLNLGVARDIPSLMVSYASCSSWIYKPLRRAVIRTLVAVLSVYTIYIRRLGMDLNKTIPAYIYI